MSAPPEDRIWRGRGWVAEIVSNEDGGGWAVSMRREQDDEPVLVVPWVMGRNKKDPKPMNAADFKTQVKAANDFLTRSQHQRRTAHRKVRTVFSPAGDPVKVVFDIVPDEFEPEGFLVATNAIGDELARIDVPPSFTLTLAAAEAWVASGYRRPDVD